MKKIALLFLSGILYSSISFAQCDTIANTCVKHLGKAFISDGQEYRALLIGTEIAEYTTTFYGGSTYRIAACSRFTDGDLSFSLYDSEHRLLFTNTNYKNSPWWDFKFASTINGTVEAQLSASAPKEEGEDMANGCAVILIGFKN